MGMRHGLRESELGEEMGRVEKSSGKVGMELGLVIGNRMRTLQQLRTFVS
jgi:hypothetical protein